jgi:hypothetical protein
MRPALLCVRGPVSERRFRILSRSSVGRAVCLSGTDPNSIFGAPTFEGGASHAF